MWISSMNTSSMGHSKVLGIIVGLLRDSNWSITSWTWFTEGSEMVASEGVGSGMLRSERVECFGLTLSLNIYVGEPVNSRYKMRSPWNTNWHSVSRNSDWGCLWIGWFRGSCWRIFWLSLSAFVLKSKNCFQSFCITNYWFYPSNFRICRVRSD